MRTLIVGMGEVGTALNEILSKKYECFAKDVDDVIVKPPIDIMHVCIRYSDNFVKIVQNYMTAFNPRFVNICSTVPVGTTRLCAPRAVHSTTRGLHPNLVEGMQSITRHVGGPDAITVANYFKKAGIDSIAHQTAKTTELAHILNNSAYGINLVFADEMNKICRHYGVDFFEAVLLYTATNNDGFHRLGHDSKCRMILTPPNGRIGGHCVAMSANLIPEEVRTPMLDILARYNDKEKKS